MNTTRRRFYIAGGIGLLLATSLFFWPENPREASGTSKSVLSKGAKFVADVKEEVAKADFIRAAGRLNDQEMVFYGKIIDQDENPVAGAKVVGGAQYNNMITSGVRNYKAYSDEAGNFVFQNIKGKDFECIVWKEGYSYLPSKYHDGYVLSKLAPAKERFTSDPKKPEIFRMWKYKGAEILLCSGGHLDIPPDGTFFYLDMKTRKQSKERGDVAFWCKYTVLPERTTHDERMVDWQFGINVVGGGVIPTDSTLPFAAPPEGYEEEWSFHIEKGVNYPTIDNQTFYIKTAEGNYGAFNVKVLYDTTYPTCSMDIGWKLNPSGSRNLEPGKEQMLKKGSYMKPGESLEYIRLRD